MESSIGELDLICLPLVLTLHLNFQVPSKPALLKQKPTFPVMTATRIGLLNALRKRPFSVNQIEGSGLDVFCGIYPSMNNLGSPRAPAVLGLLHQDFKMKVPKWGKTRATSRDFKAVLNHCSQIQLLLPCLVYYYWTISMQIQSESLSFVSSHGKGRNCSIWVRECLRGYLIVSSLSPILWISTESHLI